MNSALVGGKAPLAAQAHLRFRTTASPLCQCGEKHELAERIDVSQLICVDAIFVASCCILVSQERSQADEFNGDSVERARRPGLPCFIKSRAADCSQQIDAFRLHSKLHNPARNGEIFHRNIQTARAKFLDGAEHKPGISRRRTYPKVDVRRIIVEIRARRRLVRPPQDIQLRSSSSTR